MRNAQSVPLPDAWQEAFRREASQERPKLADPLPERRLARLLAAFILSGLFFLVLPGTLLGVWNLLGISSSRDAGSMSRAWIQAHGHAQLFGWVGCFIIGISMYVVPKFRAATLRSLPLGWAMLVLWDAAVAGRWSSGIWNWRWQTVWPLAASTELLVAVLLIWQCSPSGRSWKRTEAWNKLVFGGYLGLVLTLSVQLAAVWTPPAAPAIPETQDRVMLDLALWAFCFPVVWGFSLKFIPNFLGLKKPREGVGAYLGLAFLALAAGAALAGWTRMFATGALAAVLWACWSLRIFERAPRPPKAAGVDPRYPFFVQLAFGWLVVSALLGVVGSSHGITGASRHAFTVGFLATLIFSLGPRILPSFLNSRELWSKSLMLAAMVLLALGCSLRVTAEPLAYAGTLPAAWRWLPVSAVLELSAVLLFAWNIGVTLASPMPAWIEGRTVRADLSLYWYVTAYPETRRLLVSAGLKTLEHARRVPHPLTLQEAAHADGVDPEVLVDLLRQYFERRLARALRAKKRTAPER